MIRVGFDISQVIQRGGVPVYVENLIKSLLIADKNSEYILFGASLRRFNDLNHWIKQINGKALSKLYPIPPTALDLLWNRLHIFNIENLIGQIDTFHSSDWTQPPTKAKKVTTYHDVIPLKYPQWSHPKIVEVHKRRLRLVEEEIDFVICVSKNTMNDLLEISRIPKEKMVVIYEGVGNEFKPQSEDKVDSFKKKYNLPNEFVLSIGGVGERRNLKRVKEASKKYNLVITGENIPWLPYSELPLLYSGAKVLLYPSFYEGFGLPILEAMATGTPVITSSVSSMPEVGGDAALYVNPESVVDIENKLRMVMEDERKKEGMIKKGFAQAKKFSWVKAAKETAEVYRRLMR